MLVAETTVTTDRASRYLVQLCQHIHQIAQRHPQMQAHAEWTDGVITLGWGRCTVHAGQDTLVLRAEASTEQLLQQLEQRVSDRLEQIGRRDHLKVTWPPPTATPHTGAPGGPRQ